MLWQGPSAHPEMQSSVLEEHATPLYMGTGELAQLIVMRGTQNPPEHISLDRQSVLLTHSGSGPPVSRTTIPPLSRGPPSVMMTIPPSVPGPLSVRIIPESPPRGPPARERFRHPLPSAIDATISAAKTR
jgi:hypothetical protein